MQLKTYSIDLSLGAFSNYVDKKREGGCQLKVHTWSRDKGKVVSCKMSTIVHARGIGGQNWVKFGPRSC